MVVNSINQSYSLFSVSFMDSHSLTQSIRIHNNRRKITLLPWTSQIQHRHYSTNLLHALRRNSPTSSRHLHSTADRVLAATAKGRTRWSRAIIANPFRRWRKKQRRTHHNNVKKYSANKFLKKKKTTTTSAIQRKARVLGRLIPGCRKVSFPKLLEEAGDYISALEMQVRAMKALADLLTAGPPPPIGLS